MELIGVGYTTGVFDLFHVGHLNVLKKAKARCEKLIVGVTTDELSISHKGTRPVIPYVERREIVNSISYVDIVVPQTSMDKFAAFKALHFDAMFVGDDWQGSQAWNDYERQFAEVGVNIFYLPYTNHTSSTILQAELEKLS